MNSLLKKIGAGLVACAIAITGVMAMGGGAYAAGGPCDGAKDANNPVGALNPYECSACIGSAIAQGQTKDAALTKCTEKSEYSVDNVWGMVFTVINWVLIAVGIICVIFIIIGGIRYATSGGDTEKVKNAKNTILYALIGLVIAILANVIVQIVFNVTGTLTTTT